MKLSLALVVARALRAADRTKRPVVAAAGIALGAAPFAFAVFACGGSVASPGPAQEAGGPSEGGAPDDAPSDAATLSTDSGTCTLSERLNNGDYPLTGQCSPGARGVDECNALCNFAYCVVDPTGTDLSCAPAVDGRRPSGFSGDDVDDLALSPGDHFALAALHEALAIDAFRELASELAAHGAPEGLVRRCRDAAREEVRHARAMSRLARKYGAKVPRRPRRPAVQVRTLYELALENAVEGCVREAFGAVRNAYQARAASDPEVRAVMRTIAREERGHAELGFAIARWLETRLSPEEREAVLGARVDAAGWVLAGARRTPDATLARVAGLPSASEALAMAESLAGDLWVSRLRRVA